MSFKPSITCDRDGCTEAVAANGYDCGPEGWLRLSPGSVSEATKDFCSLDCLAQWAAQQVGKSLVKWEISVSPAAAANWAPGVMTTPWAPGMGSWEATFEVGKPVSIKTDAGKLDPTQPFGCWPMSDASAQATGVPTGTAIFDRIISAEEYNGADRDD